MSKKVETKTKTIKKPTIQPGFVHNLFCSFCYCLWKAVNNLWGYKRGIFISTQLLLILYLCQIFVILVQVCLESESGFKSLHYLVVKKHSKR